jgi:hypothetical protein
LWVVFGTCFSEKRRQRKAGGKNISERVSNKNNKTTQLKPPLTRVADECLEKGCGATPAKETRAMKLVAVG